MTSIDAVVFDIGGVLVDWDPRHLYRQLIPDEAEMEHFLETICTLEWHKDHDRGMSTAESCAVLAEQHPEHAALIHAWAERTDDMIAGTIDGTIDILAELRAAGTRLYVLSNMEADTFPRRLERYEFLRWFDDHVVSGFEGIIKPDLALFRRLLRRFDLQPDRTIFVDDSAINVEAAASIGMHAILFESPAQLRKELVAARLL